MLVVLKVVSTAPVGAGNFQGGAPDSTSGRGALAMIWGALAIGRVRDCGVVVDVVVVVIVDEKPR